tara:strand:- start:4266 stop:4373 length:108 start_codon:yes stop_codon:yes gene_type:complete
MKWTCIKCEFPYQDIVEGDAEERMCYKCLEEEKDV